MVFIYVKTKYQSILDIEMSAIIVRITSISDRYLLSTTRLLSEWDTRFQGCLDKAGYISEEQTEEFLAEGHWEKYELGSTVTHSKFCHGVLTDKRIEMKHTI